MSKREAQIEFLQDYAQFKKGDVLRGHIDDSSEQFIALEDFDYDPTGELTGGPIWREITPLEQLARSAE